MVIKRHQCPFLRSDSPTKISKLRQISLYLSQKYGHTYFTLEKLEFKYSETKIIQGKSLGTTAPLIIPFSILLQKYTAQQKKKKIHKRCHNASG
jgi:hypothetical protein